MRQAISNRCTLASALVVVAGKAESLLVVVVFVWLTTEMRLLWNSFIASEAKGAPRAKQERRSKRKEEATRKLDYPALYWD